MFNNIVHVYTGTCLIPPSCLRTTRRTRRKVRIVFLQYTYKEWRVVLKLCWEKDTLFISIEKKGKKLCCCTQANAEDSPRAHTYIHTYICACVLCTQCGHTYLPLSILISTRCHGDGKVPCHHRQHQHHCPRDEALHRHGNRLWVGGRERNGTSQPTRAVCISMSC